jgi:trehalose synthase
MIDLVDVPPGLGLDHYGSYAHLAMAVQDLRAEAAAVVPSLEGRTIWMVNSTAKGGGVAEMLPRMVSLLRELGASVEWVTITPQNPEFFALTKKLHNLIHGSGVPELTEAERRLYDDVSEAMAEELAPRLSNDDILVVHDPQPAGMGALLEQRRPGLVTIWRCHIGLDERTPQTKAAWRFLKPYVTQYDHAVFSAPEYIPPYLTSMSTVIAPAIDPLSDKNRPLTAHQLTGILCNSGLMEASHPLVYPDFEHRAMRVQPDGSFAPATAGEDPGLLFRPTVTQISRWDRLKGWKPLLDGFAKLKRRRAELEGLDARQRRRLDLVRLVLAGPEPSSIQDDPEARDVLEELIAAYARLEPEIQADVAMLSLPMTSLRQNALMVNALQQTATIVVQNSLREGFGLTATEAMWKRVPLLGSSACGLRQQVRDGVDGRLNPNPEDPDAIADVLVEMLGDPACRDAWARRGQRRVHDQFLVFAQLRSWLELLRRARHGTIQAPGRPATLSAAE